MNIDVELPDMGEDVGDEAVVSEVYVQEGDEVESGEVLLEVEADGTSFEVTAPQSGVIVELLVAEEDVVHVGDVVAILDSAEEAFPDEELFEE